MMTLIAALWLTGGAARAASAPRISVVELKGVLTMGGKSLAQGEVFDASSRVDLGTGGQATLKLDQGLILLKGPASFTAGRHALNLRSGSLLAVLRRLTSRWKVVTPRAVAAVRGTVFYIEAKPSETYLCLCEGALTVTGIGAASKAVQKIKSTHHSPYRFKSSGRRLEMVKDEMRGHDDNEIAALKALL